MPTYEYLCKSCGADFAIAHPMSDERVEREHLHAESLEPCQGPIERLISRVRINRRVGTRGPSEAELARAGFTKYVRGDNGFPEKAFGPGLDATDFVDER